MPPRRPKPLTTATKIAQTATESQLRYDNALAESINGLYKTELIKARGPWRSIDQVEIATAEWVDWYNHRRLYEYYGDIPPVELETAYYAQHQDPISIGSSN